MNSKMLHNVVVEVETQRNTQKMAKNLNKTVAHVPINSKQC